MHKRTSIVLGTLFLIRVGPTRCNRYESAFDTKDLNRERFECRRQEVASEEGGVYDQLTGHRDPSKHFPRGVEQGRSRL